jgi:hypothetical protein
LGANFTYKTSSGDLYMATNGYNSSSAPQMVLSASGNLLVGTTSQVQSGKLCTNFDGGIHNALVLNDTTANSSIAYAYFSRSGVTKGSITFNGTSVAYNTSSDYRLKESIAPMTGALATVAQLKPCNYTWKETGEESQGFIAHELQEVVPECVVGEKDAVDEEGNPQYQGIDTSFLVATLTAAIQELKAIVDTQAAKIAALEAK